MDEALAIVLAGIGGAAVSGVVGVVSSTMSLRAARRQAEQQRRETEQDRRHQVHLVILQRRHQALEIIWRMLFVLESNGSLTERDMEVFILNLLWIPADLQSTCLRLLESTEARSQDMFLQARKSLMREANSFEPAEN